MPVKEVFLQILIKKKIITLSPLEMNYNVYLAASFELTNDKLVFKIKSHKFLKEKDKKNFFDKEVPLMWIKGFLDFRENQARQETDRYREFEKDRKKKNENDYKVAEESIKKSEVYEKDQDGSDFEENYPTSGSNAYVNDTSWYDGPLNDDWDASNWEDYMGGPDY